ncbi:Flp pilus assembly protein CpaB [Paraburkholderia sp. ZP32-5]|uniref:Flp pilus assembly protein CpaB n=1 Tax=Paraburkholderia sp. ZP32-5 TaxID=2883245 RepID=UPI001F1FCAF0|nr:Flp pilus assembly protein CpaB [Paraburkholderia sp. ZP32-5]
MPNLTRIFAGVLIALALLLGFFAWSLSRRPAPVAATPAARSFQVVVASRPLPAGKPISVDALRVQSLPINPNGAFTDPSQLAGRVPNADIGSDAPVLAAQLASGLAERIEPGERALAVRVDESNAVGNRLRPGNFVDVFFTLKRDGNFANGAEIDHTQARLLLSKVRVLAFGNATAGGDGGGNSGGDPTGPVRTAVLAVPLADVDRLTLAESSGRLVFALRNPRDADVVDQSRLPAYPEVLKTAAQAGDEPLQDSTRAAAGIALDALSGSANAAARPAAPRAPIAPTRVASRTNSTNSATGSIEVIRGGRTETVAW